MVSTRPSGTARPVADAEGALPLETAPGVRAGTPPRPRRRANLSAIAVIAHRDLIKLLRDRVRLVSELAFPLILVLVLGPVLQAGFGSPGGINLTFFVFTGVLTQTIWQSSVLGLVSLLADREEDFSQEIFVSPVSRYSIIAGKVIGESLVAMPTGFGIIVIGIIAGVPLSPLVLVALVPVLFLVAVYGGAFGLLILANLSTQRQANQIFPFVLLPQFFLAGIFNPIHDVPPLLAVLSALSPLRWAVELTRHVIYGLQPSVPAPQLTPLPVVLAVMVLSFVGFMILGTLRFVRREQNR
jgi:ABC-2 type transport system permease protein